MDQILWNAVTSPGTLSSGYSVKTTLYKPPSPILHCIRLLGENIADQGYRFSNVKFLYSCYDGNHLVNCIELHRPTSGMAVISQQSLLIPTTPSVRYRGYCSGVSGVCPVWIRHYANLFCASGGATFKPDRCATNGTRCIYQYLLKQ